MSGSRRDIAVFPPTPDTAETMRLECLRLAVQADSDLSADQIVQTAATFFAFVRPRAAERMADLVPTVSP